MGLQEGVEVGLRDGEELVGWDEGEELIGLVEGDELVGNSVGLKVARRGKGVGGNEGLGVASIVGSNVNGLDVVARVGRPVGVYVGLNVGWGVSTTGEEVGAPSNSVAISSKERQGAPIPR